ncbi:hypothetical protein F1728_25135 [Gimesia benthica]|uniref:Uncharacterized protein n=1 Tax=Gimesia benthica TaxID=2608982 RepID=A0A6I6AKR5_9PLAN|nr:hypothetical protein [Gimesia benthica]QGQ25755.1 hypothetical protein F1728_25135 [Gimesia benthica]
MIQQNLLSFWFCRFVAVLFLTVLASRAVAEENPKQKQTEISQSDLHSYQLLARVAYQIGKEDLSLPKDGISDSLMTANGQLKHSLKLTPAMGTKAKVSETLDVSCKVKFDFPEFPIAKANMFIPVILVISCENSKTGYLWTQFARPVLRITKEQPAKAEISMGDSNFTAPSGEYMFTTMLFTQLSPERPPFLLNIKRTQFSIKPEKEKAQLDQKRLENSEKDLYTFQLLARVAYQIGKDDLSLPKDGMTDALMTANGPIEASINKLTPVAGTSTKASEIQEISCNTKYNWPEFPSSKADMSIPTFLALSCENSISGHLWTQFSRSELRIHKGQPAMAEEALIISRSMDPDKYKLTAMMFLKLSPESPLVLLDIKRSQFTVKAEKKKSQHKQKSDGLKEKSKK